MKFSQQSMLEGNVGKINSPYRYPGGKFYARSLVSELTPPHQQYCEPFAGGASIFFAKSKAANSWLNDLDENVVNTFCQIRDNVEQMIAVLDGTEASKKMHSYYKKEYQPTNSAEKAARWFYLNRTSYSGIVKPENCYWGYDSKYSMPPENWPAHLRKVSLKLQNVKITSQDFQQVLDAVENGCFVFADPPYYDSDQHKFYAHSFGLEEHERLCECLRKNSDRIKFLLTYDNHEDVREMYSWCSVIEDKQWNYTITRTDYRQKEGETKGSREKGREIFIRNYLM